MRYFWDATSSNYYDIYEYQGLTSFDLGSSTHYIPYTSYASAPYANILAQTKASILARQTEAVQAIQTSKLAALQIHDDTTLLEAEALLSGKAFAALGNVTAPQETQAKDPANSTEALELLNAAKGKVDDIGGFINQMNNYVTNFFATGNYPKTYQEYAAIIVDNFANTKKRATSGAVENEIINAILTGSHQSLFRMDAGAETALPTSLAKIIALATALPQANVSEVTAISESGAEGLNSKLYEELAKKIRSYVYYLKAAAKQAASAKGLIDCDYAALDALNKLETTFTKSGGGGVTTTFIPSAQQKTMYERANSEGKTLGNRSYSQSGVTMTINNGGATAQMDFLVADKQAKPSTGAVASSTDLVLRGQMSLLTALTRDANLSSYDMFALFAAAGARDGGQADADWDLLMENITYKVFLSLFVGMSAKGNERLYLVSNGWIYTLQDILTQMASGNVSAQVIEKVKRNNQAGLSRATYSAMNQWVGQSAPNLHNAALRNQQLGQSISAKMYSTIISVNLSILEMAALTKMN